MLLGTQRMDLLPESELHIFFCIHVVATQPHGHRSFLQRKEAI